MSWLLNMTFRRAMRIFLAGLLAILPVVITLVVVAWVAGLLRQVLGPNALLGQAIRGLGLAIVSDPRVAYALGALVVLSGVFLVGIAVESGARSLLQRIADGLLQRIPIIGSVYGTSKQLVAMLDKKSDDPMKGMQTVFCFFGRERGAGVLALLVSPQVYTINGRNYQVVIVPTAPVPIGGGLFFVPVEVVQPTDLTAEALMSIYVSMGITAAQFLPRAGGELTASAQA